MGEQIVAVAVRVGDLVVSAPQPARHHHVLHALHAIGIEDRGPDAQGFLTSTGRFVGRYEARDLARIAGQIAKKVGHPDMLFSEDVW